MLPILPRVARFVFVVAACILLCGCWVYSVYPLSTNEDQLVMDKTLLGAWWQPEAGCTLTLSRFFEDNIYRAVYAAPAKHSGTGCLVDDGRTAAFEGRLIKLNGYQFLDLYPVDRDPQHHDLALHSIYKVNRLNDTMALVPIDIEWLKARTFDEKLVQPSKSGDNALVLTMDTDALQRFVSDHAGDNEAFNPAKQIQFHKRPE